MRPRILQLLVVAAVAAAAVVAMSGCGGDDDDKRVTAPPGETRTTAPPPAETRATAPPPADAGVRAGHAADPRRVAVPDADATPPTTSIALEVGGRTLTVASQPGEAPPETVRLGAPRLRGTATGTDAESGAARVRVSVSERIVCQAGGRTVERARVRYFPPPQIERIRSSPGARIPVRARRSVVVALGRGRCPPGAAVTAVDGELWGETTNGLGLEAVTPHIHFRWRG